jgi:hypothetical protein
MPEADRIEASRHDPLLRLDQFIHRQDQMIAWQRRMVQLMSVIVFELGILVLLGIAAIFLAFKF